MFFSDTAPFQLFSVILPFFLVIQVSSLDFLCFFFFCFLLLFLISLLLLLPFCLGLFPLPLELYSTRITYLELWQHVQNLENRTPVYTLRWRVLHLLRKQGIISQKIKTFKNTSKTVHKGYCTIQTGLETNQKFILTSSTTISKLHFDTHQ